MKITGSDTVMTSTSGHTAHAVDERNPYGGSWRVSWLPGRTVSYNQATTALVLAAHITAGAISPAHPHWPHVQSWAAELDLTPAEAVTAVQSVPSEPVTPERTNTVSTAVHSAAALYDSATRRLDEVIKLIEDVPVSGLSEAHVRTAVRLLAEAYDLWRGLVAARDALTTSTG